MPVNVLVSLVAAKGKDVHTLCTDLLAHSFAYIVDQTLQVRILVYPEIRGDLLQMLLGADKGVPDLPGESSAFTV